MRTSWLRLLLMLLVAAVVSILVGLAVNWIATMMPCQGERLSCNISQAVGAYAVLIWAVLSPMAFGVTLLVARNRVALLGAMVVLLAPLATFFFLETYERWFSGQADFYIDGRTFLAMVAPPSLAINVQWLVLRAGVKLPGPETKGATKADAAKA